MSTLTLNPADVAHGFHSSASACRKRLFQPVEQGLDQDILDFVSQFSGSKKFRSGDYTFIPTVVPVPVPSSTHRKRSLEAAAVVEEDDQDSELQDFPADKKVRSDDYTFRAEWANMLVSVMTAASSEEDAESRGDRMFDAFKVSVSLGKEAEALDKKMKAVEKENEILKRAVVKLDLEQAKYVEQKNEEVEELNEAVGKYEEKVKRLKLDKYRLELNLKQAMHRPNPAGMGSHFRPDVY